jgi:hypothetical protein
MPMIATFGAGSARSFGFGANNGPLNFEYLVIAGGAGGGKMAFQDYNSGGGGAGGLLQSSATVLFGTYTVTVGAGGALISGTGRATGNNGANSSLGALAVAIGGGGGASGTTNFFWGCRVTLGVLLVVIAAILHPLDREPLVKVMLVD